MLIGSAAMWFLFLSGNTAFRLISELARQFGPRRGGLWWGIPWGGGEAGGGGGGGLHTHAHKTDYR